MLSSSVGNSEKYDLLPSTVRIGESLERRPSLFCGKLVGTVPFSLDDWGHHMPILGNQLVTIDNVVFTQTHFDGLRYGC